MKRNFNMVLAVLLFVFFSASARAGEAWYGDHKITGPYTHKNLSVYLVHGNDTAGAGDYMTLEEAMDSGLLKIYETGSVNNLRVQNKSKKKKIFIQSGDIIRGGKQDRVIKHDMIINIYSGDVNIDVFCVEAGRWQKRGSEDAGYFSSSKLKISSRDLKLAANSSESQQDVWNAVEDAQVKLEKNTGKSVRAGESSSSLLLTLENRDVDRLSNEYVEAIERAVSGQRDVIGFVFAINGEINSGDIYASRTLFEKLWDKQIKASAVEAVAEMDNGSKSLSPQPSAIADWMNEASLAQTRKQEIDNYNIGMEADTDENLSYESYDAGAPSQYIHKSIIKK